MLQHARTESSAEVPAASEVGMTEYDSGIAEGVPRQNGTREREDNTGRNERET